MGPGHVEFNGKREEALLTNERLQQEAQAVLDVIENPDVAQALRQDKNQNLQYLKENYNVRFLQRHTHYRWSSSVWIYVLTHHTGCR